MKKIYLLLVFMLTVSVSFAQGRNSRLSSGMLSNPLSSNAVNKKDLNMQKSAVQIKAVESDEKVVVTGFNNVQEAMQARQNAPQAAPFVQYLNPAGTFYYGYTRDYRAYSTYLLLYTPAMTTLDFIPYTDTDDVTFSWVLPTSKGDQSLASETDKDGVLHRVNDILPAGYIYSIPKVTATAAGGSSTYQLGQGVTTQYMFAGNVERDEAMDDGTSLGATAEYPSLTLVNMHANKPASGNLYGLFEQGGFSPKYTHSQYGQCTGIMQILPQMPSPFYAESVSVLAITQGGTAMPTGGQLKIQLYYLTEAGDLGELIAESTTNEFVKTFDSQGVFVFTFEEEEDGFIFPKPLVLGTKAPIAVIISGFDDTWDFNVLFGTNGSLPGSSYTLHGNNIATFGFQDAPNLPRADVYFQFNGIFNCLSLYEGTPSMNFPIAGGWGIASHDENGEYNDLILYSSHGLADIWIEDLPEWITSYDADNSYFESDNIIALFFSAEALPDGITGRSDEIIIGSYGITVKIPVTQGNVLSIPSSKTVEVPKVACQGDNFLLSYPTSSTSVSVYNIAGQRIGNYKLNASGSYTLPANDWSKGVYIFKFDGSNATVKVIK